MARTTEKNYIQTKRILKNREQDCSLLSAIGHSKLQCAPISHSPNVHSSNYLIVNSVFSIRLFFSYSPELEEQPTNARDLPWVAFYCVLKQDEQAFTTYCSEEFSVSSGDPFVVAKHREAIEPSGYGGRIICSFENNRMSDSDSDRNRSEANVCICVVNVCAYVNSACAICISMLQVCTCGRLHACVHKRLCVRSCVLCVYSIFIYMCLCSLCLPSGSPTYDWAIECVCVPCVRVHAMQMVYLLRE